MVKSRMGKVGSWCKSLQYSLANYRSPRILPFGLHTSPHLYLQAVHAPGGHGLLHPGGHEQSLHPLHHLGGGIELLLSGYILVQVRLRTQGGGGVSGPVAFWLMHTAHPYR